MKIYSPSFIVYLLIELVTVPFSENKVEKSSIEPFQNSQNIGCSVSGVLDDLEKQNQAIDIDVWAKDRRMRMAPYTIPIVVHLIEDVPTITDLQVQNAIADLNNAFANGLDVPGAIPGANTQVDFCLATRAPDGGLTNGINRITSPLEEFDQDLEDSKLKTTIGWDPRHYLNIWTVGFINSELAATYDSREWWSRGPVGGYATLPGSIIGANSFTDGVAAAGLGVGLWAHEVGHYMGLLHTFEPTNEQDCVNDDCERDGDMVCDTPPDSSISDYSVCGGSAPNSSCGTDTLSNYSNGFYMTDVDDDFRNFMDYGNGACQAHFTQGQKNRMLFHIESYRTLLYTQAPSNNNACTVPCVSNVSIDFFTQSENNPVVGMPVTFESTSANATNFEWYVELITPIIADTISTSMLKGYAPSTAAVATTADLTHPFSAVGKYRVYLKAWDTDPNCFASYSRIVRVGCGVESRFYPNKRLIASKQPQSNFQDTVTFFNRSIGAATYEWTVKHLPLEKPDGTFDAPLPDFLSGDMDLEYIFPEPGMYEITLKAINGACEDSMGPFKLEVEDPTIDANLFVFGADCFNEDSIRVSYQVWNRGYDTLSAGMPISFYEQNPRSTNPALSLLKTISLPEIIYGSEAKNYVEYVKRSDLAKINNVFVAFNDPGTTTPPTDLFPEGAKNALSANVDLPASGIPELNYGNNVHSDQDLQFDISASPITATVCHGDTYDININANDTGGSFTTDWQANNGASLDCSNCLDQTVTMGTQNTIVKLEVTSKYGCKESITFNLTVRNPTPTINTTPEICLGTVSPNFNTFMSSGSHTWYTSNTAVTGDPNPTVDTTTPGNRSLWVSKTAASCEGIRIRFDYKIKPAPQASITNPSDACVGDTAPIITDIVSGSGTFKWYNVDTGGSQIPEPTLHTASGNTFEYWVTQITDGCESVRSRVSYTVHPIPQKPAVTAAPVCINDGIPLLSGLVTGNNLIWYDTNNAVIAQPGFETDVAREFNYFVTQTINNCESSKSAVNYDVKPLSEKPEVIEQPVCINDNIPLLINLVKGTNLEWYDSNSNAIVQPSFDTGVVGLFNYFVTQTTNGCESPLAPLTYEVKPLSAAPQIDIIGDKCLNEGLFVLSDFVTGANVQWYSSANSVDPIIVPRGKTDVEGTVTHWITQNVNGCESQRTPVSYVVHPIPEIPAVSPIDICLDDNSQKLSDYVSGENLIWYTSAVQGDSSDQEFAIKADVAGSYMYWVTQTINGCVSPRAEIPYNVYQIDVTDDGPYKIDEGQSQEINLIINQTPDLGPVSTTWFDASGQIGSGNSITVNPMDPTFYSIDTENAFGCITEHEVYVNVIHFLYSAEIFSPNGDGLNEFWQIKNIEEFPTIKVSVYNRWGKIVFQSFNYSNDWNGDVNGTPLPVGTYYFIIDQSDYDREALTGSVTIIR